MKDIRISPRAQMGGLLAVGGVIAALIVAQLPEAKRYLKMESM
jgi:hypothetical protein